MVLSESVLNRAAGSSVWDAKRRAQLEARRIECQRIRSELDVKMADVVKRISNSTRSTGCVGVSGALKQEWDGLVVELRDLTAEVDCIDETVKFRSRVKH